MKLLAIGDPHGDLEKIKKIPLDKIELILLTGDLGSANLMRKRAFENIERRKKGLPEKEYSSQQEKAAFMEAFDSSLRVVKYLAKHAPVFTIYGNVESSNAETKKHSKEIGMKLPFLTDNLKKIKNVKIINNRLVNFNGIKILGLEYFIDVNWVREFKPSDFKKRLKSAEKETKKAKRVLTRFNDVDILVCHQPPYKILDKVTGKSSAPKHWHNKHAGSKTILNYVKDKQPKYVFCGHIHEGEGFKKVGKTKVYNLGVCDWKVVDLN